MVRDQTLVNRLRKNLSDHNSGQVVRMCVFVIKQYTLVLTKGH